MRIVIGLLLLLPVISGCGRGSAAGPLAATPATASAATLEDLRTGKRDCLQYPVAKFADGTEDWNADWVYFSLIRSSDSKLVRDAKGQPLAASLLLSQVEQFEKEHGDQPGTSWCYVVKRTKRHLRDGRVLSQSEYVTLDDVELAGLIAKDKAARAR